MKLRQFYNGLQKSQIAHIILLWGCWAILLFAFQAYAQLRIQPIRPDNALGFTSKYTLTAPQKNGEWPSKRTLFLSSHVAWDSTYYLSIAEHGYNDPQIKTVCAPEENLCYSVNYAFFPLYPFLIRSLASPLISFGLDPQKSFIFIGMVISLLGTLLGMISIYLITVNKFEAKTALNAPFFLIIFPSSFFLLQVFTDGLFLGLSFSTLYALSKKKYPIASGLWLLALATRPNGILLSIPFFLTILIDALKLKECPFIKRALIFIKRGWTGFIPLLIFGFWYFSKWGHAFHIVEKYNFGRTFINLSSSWAAIVNAFQQIFTGNPQSSAYFMVEFILLFIGVIACIATLKSEPVLSLYSLSTLLLTLTSGPMQSISRYLLAMPVIYLFLVQCSKNRLFERAWSIFSLLLFAMSAILFSFDFWVG